MSKKLTLVPAWIFFMTLGSFQIIRNNIGGWLILLIATIGFFGELYFTIIKKNKI